MDSHKINDPAFACFVGKTDIAPDRLYFTQIKQVSGSFSTFYSTLFNASIKFALDFY